MVKPVKKLLNPHGRMLVRHDDLQAASLHGGDEPVGVSSMIGNEP